MVQRIVTHMVDDLDGTASPDISTVGFALDGVAYEIDLTGRNRRKLADLLEEYVRAARTIGGRQRRATRVAISKPRTPTDRAQTRAIRDWARRNRFKVSDRGRIPDAVIEAFEAAHKNRKPAASASSSTTRIARPTASPRRKLAVAGSR